METKITQNACRNQVEGQFAMALSKTLDPHISNIKDMYLRFFLTLNYLQTHFVYFHYYIDIYGNERAAKATHRKAKAPTFENKS